MPGSQGVAFYLDLSSVTADSVRGRAAAAGREGHQAGYPQHRALTAALPLSDPIPQSHPKGLLPWVIPRTNHPSLGSLQKSEGFIAGGDPKGTERTRLRLKQ